MWILVARALLAALIFLAPTHFFLKFFESDALVHGLLVDYLLVKLYLSDLVGLALIFWLLLGKRLSLSAFYSHSKSAGLFLGIIALCATLVWLISGNSPESFAAGCRFLGAIVLTVLINRSLPAIGKNTVFGAVLATLWFQGLVSLYHLIFQRSAVGFLLFGEPNLQAYAGISKGTLAGAEYILPYGTTAHPNVLAGILGFYSLYAIWHASKQAAWQPLALALTTSCMSLAIILSTQSISGLVALLLGLLALIYAYRTHKTARLFLAIATFLISQVIIMLSLPTLATLYPNNLSITRRFNLQEAAINMIVSAPITGIGLNQFTRTVETYAETSEVVRFVQPVHNIALLFAAELGIAGLLGLFLGLYILHTKLQVRPPALWALAFLLPIALWDHYLVTHQAGILLLAFTWSLTQEKIDKKLK